jgi:hypothetical protein
MRTREICAGEKKTIEYLQKEKQGSLQDKIVDNTTGDGGELRSIIGPFSPVDQGSWLTIMTLTSTSSLKSNISTKLGNKQVLHNELSSGFGTFKTQIIYIILMVYL